MLFHRSSTGHSCRKRLRLVLRGGGCNRVPLLLFSRPLPSTLAHHQHQHPTTFRSSLSHSSSFVQLVVVSLPSRSVLSRLVSSVFPVCYLVFVVAFRSFVRSPPLPWTAAPVVHQRCVLCRPRSARLPAPRPSPHARMRVCARLSPCSLVVHQRCVLCRPSHHTS